MSMEEKEGVFTPVFICTNFLTTKIIYFLEFGVINLEIMLM